MKQLDSTQFFLIFIYIFTTQSVFGMNASQYTPLTNNPKKFAQYAYGSWFKKNQWTADFVNNQDEIYCRMHTPILAYAGICCVISHAISPCNPCTYTCVGTSTCALDQVLGCYLKKNTETVVSIDINQTVQPKIYTLQTKTYQTGE